jgi:hypothetical protein
MANPRRWRPVATGPEAAESGSEAVPALPSGFLYGVVIEATSDVNVTPAVRITKMRDQWNWNTGADNERWETYMHESLAGSWSLDIANQQTPLNPPQYVTTVYAVTNATNYAIAELFVDRHRVQYFYRDLSVHPGTTLRAYNNTVIPSSLVSILGLGQLYALTPIPTMSGDLTTLTFPNTLAWGPLLGTFGARTAYNTDIVDFVIGTYQYFGVTFEHNETMTNPGISPVYATLNIIAFIGT